MVAMNPIEASENTLSLMMLVTGAAASAQAAQDLMSTPAFPVAVEKFRVKFNLACNVQTAMENDVRLSLFGELAENDWRMSTESQLGFSLDFTLKQQSLITAEAFTGQTIAGDDYDAKSSLDGTTFANNMDRKNNKSNS